MTDSNRQLTMVETARANPTQALDLASARGAIEGSALLVRVFEAAGMTQKELALRAGVSEGRVSQVLGVEENLRLSTVSRYLEAMGYQLDLAAKNKATGQVVEARPKPARRRRSRGKVPEHLAMAVG